jgi:periodic tryptophan protein 2
LFINLPRQVVLSRFNFKRKVMAIKFSPDDEMFAVTHGQGCQVWCSPGIAREFSPLRLNRVIAGHHDETTTLDWSADSESIIMGSKDLSARIYYRVKSKYMSVSVLSGHRDELIGAYFAGDDANVAYTVAVDGAVFTWNFIESEREVIESKRSRKKRQNLLKKRKQVSDNSSDSEEPTDDEEEEDGEEEGEGEASESALVPVATKRTSKWVLKEREFLWDPQTRVSSTAYNKASGLLVVGFTTGVFGLYEMPGCINVHRLSVSSNSVSSVSINSTGEWLAVGSAELGQLLVWEWRSESYVLKQQGHLYGLNSMDYSSDGQFIATGGEDGKVKIWNAFSGFCFITFSEHTAPVTGVKFIGKGLGKALISASLDGTVRAHDLLRYKNFRTLTTPDPVQFTCLAVDSSGEIVCAGALDPFHIYVWALQTGKLIDVLAGHEGPIACLDFSRGNSTLASGSWDGTLKLWDVYKNECTETFEHGCDVLACAFRPDGKEICCSATNGNLYFWDVEAGAQVCIIEGRHDISGGRLTTDAMTAQNSSRSKFFTSVAYTADGSCVLAGGRSKYTCIYAVLTGILVKKFQLSHNRSLEGIVDEIRSDRLVDGVALDNLKDLGAGGGTHLPGQKHSSLSDGSRTTRPEVITSALQFSPTGRDWAVVSTQGLQVFSLDDAMLFAPTDLDIAITPQAVYKALGRSEFGAAVNMALHLGERAVLKRAVDGVALDSIPFVVKSLDPRMLKDLLKFVADEIVRTFFFLFINSLPYCTYPAYFLLM